MACDGETLSAERARSRVLALMVGQHASTGEGAGARRNMRWVLVVSGTFRDRQKPRQPLPALGEVAARVPEPPQRRGQSQSCRGISFHRAVQGRPQVVV